MGQNAGNIFRGKKAAASFEKPFISVFNSHDLDAKIMDGGLGNRPDDGIQSRAITAARQNSDSAKLCFLQNNAKERFRSAKILKFFARVGIVFVTIRKSLPCTRIVLGIDFLGSGWRLCISRLLLLAGRLRRILRLVLLLHHFLAHFFFDIFLLAPLSFSNQSASEEPRSCANRRTCSRMTGLVPNNSAKPSSQTAPQKRAALALG